MPKLILKSRHRLLCGDSTNPEHVARLMGGAQADLCFTSPPYGQQRDYTAEGKAKVADWDGLMRGVFANLPMSDAGQVLVNLGLIHRDGEWIPYWDGWIEWMRSQGWRRFGWYVWDQGSGLPGDWCGRLAPSHEFIFHFNRQSERPQKWVETTNRGPKKSSDKGMRKSDGSIGAISSPSKCGGPVKIPDSVVRIYREQSRTEFTKAHPAVFPVAFPSFVVQSWPGDIYEPFCGSGTTIIAAEQLQRRSFGMEIAPQYCDIILRRFENLTGEKPVLSPSAPSPAPRPQTPAATSR